MACLDGGFASVKVSQEQQVGAAVPQYTTQSMGCSGLYLCCYLVSKDPRDWCKAWWKRILNEDVSCNPPCAKVQRKTDTNPQLVTVWNVPQLPGVVASSKNQPFVKTRPSYLSKDGNELHSR